MHSKKHPVAVLLFLALLAIPLAILGTPYPTRADTLCVHPTGAFGCYTTIQAAVDAANHGDTIQVAEGTYTASGSQVVGISQDIELQGGWSSDFSARSRSDYPTIIDGEQARIGIYVTGGNPTISGFIIINGRNIYGGGICENNASGHTTIEDNEIRDNTATPYYGGGIYSHRGNITIRNNVIRSNTAGAYGGGIYILALTTDATALIEGNTISYNTANTEDGGGIFTSLPGVGSCTIRNNTIRDNTAGDHGGGIDAGGSPAIQGNHILSNIAASGGGGISLYEGSQPQSSIRQNVIRGNVAPVGSGILIERGDTTIQNNIVVRNGDASSTGTGGIYLAQEYSDHPTVEFNTIAYNRVGGIYSGGSEPGMFNNIVASNQGFGIESSGGAPSLDFNDVWDNSPDYSGLSAGTHDISVDPQFQSAVDEDYHLSEGSLCIDAADPTSTLSVDFEGDSRPQGDGYDIGADESPYSSATPAAVSIAVNEVLYDPAILNMDLLPEKTGATEPEMG